MSRISTAPFATPRVRRQRVCASCFGDDDLRSYIRDQAGTKGCDFCGHRGSPTVPIEEIADYIRAKLEESYGKAVDQLPYESREGGYQGWTVDTYDLLFDTVGIDLPRDHNGSLAAALVEEIGDDCWCDYDWLVLEPDESLRFSWRRFCDIVKHSRRFFFHNIDSDLDDPDSRSPVEFLREVCHLAENRGLITTLGQEHHLYRARPRKAGQRHTTASALGPPPPEAATQSNRMNPPGIPMFYGADNLTLAVAETRAKRVSVGIFEPTQPLRLLDLANLPPTPGFFSDASRDDRLSLAFLHDFARVIVEPVERDDRVHVEYIPTQVFSEFLRDYQFPSGRIHGVRYRSATGKAGANIVLFAGPKDVEGGDTSPFGTPTPPLIRLVGVRHRE